MRLLLLLSLLWSFPASALQEQPFDEWLIAFKNEALGQGIRSDVIDDAFTDVKEPSADILELDRKQPEKILTFSQYVRGVVTPKRIAAAKERWASHRQVLNRIRAAYHVPPTILLALWSLESNFGERQGDFSITQSLATLAYDGRRSAFFRKELMTALHIMQDENIDTAHLTGSWAGAMGQTQFMPSSFVTFAVDFDDDGRKDIWQSDADALASIANYLHSKGWNPKYGWGMEVSLSAEDREKWRGKKESKPMWQWRKLGIRKKNGKALPRLSQAARLVVPDDGSAAYLVFSNYDVIMDWNRSIYFATSVGLLADVIGKK